MKNDNLILIIARDRGKNEVSRQNLRLINGKPLLFYILKTALSCKNCSTFVSTDSDEIDAYSKFYGAQTIRRERRLTKDDVALEEIALDALEKFSKKGKNFKKCLIINPHFPLIRKKTINTFFSKLNKNTPVVYGFENKLKQGIHFSYHTNKKNVPQLIKTQNKIVEIKKVASFDCQTLLNRKNFKNKIFGLEINII